jgi:hypothetical protein
MTQGQQLVVGLGVLLPLAQIYLLNEMFGGSQMIFHKHISGSSSWEPLKGE